MIAVPHAKMSMVSIVYEEDAVSYHHRETTQAIVTIDAGSQLSKHLF